MMLWILVAVIFLLVVGYMADRMQRRPDPVARSAQAAVVPRTVWESIPEDTRRARALDVSAKVFAAMEIAAKGDAWSAALATRFHDSAIAAYLGPGGEIMTAQKAYITKEAVFLVVASSREYDAIRQPRKASFSFVGGDRAFYVVTDSPLSPTVLGVVALHEAVHWDDIRSGREQVTARGREWVRGELRAHIVENLALDRLTAGRFSQELRIVIADPSLTNVFRPGWPTRIPNQEGTRRLYAALGFPSPEPADAELMMGAVLIASLIAQGEEEEQQISFLDELYKQYGITHYR